MRVSLRMPTLEPDKFEEFLRSPFTFVSGQVGIDHQGLAD